MPLPPNKFSNPFHGGNASSNLGGNGSGSFPLFPPLLQLYRLQFTPLLYQLQQTQPFWGNQLQQTQPFWGNQLQQTQPFGGNQPATSSPLSVTQSAGDEAMRARYKKRPIESVSDDETLDAARKNSVSYSMPQGQINGKRRKPQPLPALDDDDSDLSDDESVSSDKNKKVMAQLPNKPVLPKKKPQDSPCRMMLSSKTGQLKAGDFVEGAPIDKNIFLSTNLKTRFKIGIGGAGIKLRKDKPSVTPPLGKDVIKKFMDLGSKSDKEAFYTAMQKLARDAREAKDPNDPAKKKFQDFMSIMAPTRPDASNIKEELDSYIRSDAWTRKGDKSGYGEDETMQTSLFMLMLRRTAGEEKGVSPVSVMDDGTEFDWLDLHRGLRNPTGYMPLGGQADKNSAHPGTLNSKDPSGGGRPKYMSRLNAELDEMRAREIMRSKHPMSAARRAKRVERRLLRDSAYLKSDPSYGYAVTGYLHSDPVQIEKNIEMMRNIKNMSRVFAKVSKTAVDESDSEAEDTDVDEDFDSESATHGMKTPKALTATFAEIQNLGSKYAKKIDKKTPIAIQGQK